MVALPWRKREDPIELQEAAPSTREIGSSGQTQYSAFGLPEYNADLRGNRALKAYDQMRRSDAQVRATLRLVKTPIISAQWYMDPASDNDQDKEVADFVDWNLNHLRRTFIDFLWESLLMLDFGSYIFERVFERAIWTPPKTGQRARRERPVVKWADFAPRHPSTIDHWEFESNGSPKAVYHNRIDGATGKFERLPIPYDKTLVFTLDKEAGDPTGMSVLRSSYKHWFYKENLYKIDAIQKERHGIGIPIVHLPIGFTPDDVKTANELGENLRTNEKAHVTLPPGWNIEMLAMNTNLVDVLASAVHHNRMIAANVLGQFLELGISAQGSRALGGDLIGLFFRSLRYVADIIRSELNLRAIPELVRYNYAGVENFPTLRVRRIGDTADWRALSAAIRNLKESGFLTPDGETEKWVRDQMDFPAASTAALGRPVEERAAGRSNPRVNPGAGGDSSEQAARQGNRTAARGDRVPPEGSPIGGR